MSTPPFDVDVEVGDIPREEDAQVELKRPAELETLA